MMYGIDLGHGGKDPGAVANGLTEKDLVLAVGLKLLNRLNQLGIPYAATRLQDQDVPLASRVMLFNVAAAEAVISLHFNSFTSSEPRGYEVFHQHGNAQSKLLAEHIAGQLSLALGPLGVPPRKPPVKTRLNPDGTEYYYLLRELRVPTVIVEPLFLSNPQDAALLKQEGTLDTIAVALVNAVVQHENSRPPVPVTEPAPPPPPVAEPPAPEPPSVAPPPPSTGTPIIGPSVASLAQAQEWARQRGAHQRFIDIASAYWHYGALAGIRPEVAYTQAAKETAFGRYGGAVRPEQNNWAGIKTRNATGDRPEDHETFPTPEDGVRGHFNHLCAYTGLPPVGEPHGRYHLVKTLAWAGSIRHVEELGGRWAPNPDYGQSIVRDYLAPMVATPEPIPPPAVTVALEEYLRVVAALEAAETKLARIREIVG